MKKSELRQLIREELLKEYSFKVIQNDGTTGYIDSDNIDKLLFQMSKFLTGSSKDFVKKELTAQDYKNIILLIARYLSKKNPNLNGEINFS